MGEPEPKAADEGTTADRKIPEWERTLAVSERELEAYAGALEIVEASIKTGQLTCPRLFPGQYVTRGDALVTVSFYE